MSVIIGVDPHKATHQAVAVDDREDEIDRISVLATNGQTGRLVAWAASFEPRLWAVEGAEGLGYLLSQQLVAAGERVVNVPATLASRTRWLATSQSDKNDPNDAHAVAVTALRHDGLRRVEAVGHAEVLRLLAKRNTDIGDRRTHVVARLHALLVDLVRCGIAKEINASDLDSFPAWFETGQRGPSFRTAEIIETSGEGLMLCRIQVSFPSGQTSELLQIYRYDDAVERLELVIASDVEDIDAARNEFAELADTV